MAAWLAFLKSRLLLPEPATPDGPSAEEMATALANRLRRLEAIREAANRLMNRPQFQRDIFPARQSGIDRRNPPSQIHRDPVRSAHRLFRAAPAARAGHRASGQAHGVVADGSARLAGAADRHRRGLELPRRISCCNYVVDPSQHATVFASSFAAALELVREGEMELNQKEAFAPLYFRKRPPQASGAMSAPDLSVE